MLSWPFRVLDIQHWCSLAFIGKSSIYPSVFIMWLVSSRLHLLVAAHFICTVWHKMPNTCSSEQMSEELSWESMLCTAVMRTLHSQLLCRTLHHLFYNGKINLCTVCLERWLSGKSTGCFCRGPRFIS